MEKGASQGPVAFILRSVPQVGKETQGTAKPGSKTPWPRVEIQPQGPWWRTERHNDVAQAF